MNKIVSLLLAATISVGAAAKNNISINPDESIGFNALDYVLQKPLGNDTFPSSQGLSQRFFISLGMGTEAIGDEFGAPRIKPGYKLSADAGYWFTPVHGLRLGVDAGLKSVHKGDGRVWSGGLRAEYMVNFTNLLRGYNPARWFELSGSVGLVGERVRRNGVWIGQDFGATAAMQCRFNVQPSLYLYAEPRLTMLSGKRYDPPYDWRRTKVNLSFNVGVGYRLLTGEERQRGATPFYQTDDDNFYFGVGGGIVDMTRPNFPHSFFSNHCPYGTAFAGKMFTAESGLEVSMNFGRMGPSTLSSPHYFATTTLAYSLNLNNALGGYRPDQRFQIFLNMGPSLAYQWGKKYLGYTSGLTAVYNVLPNWGIFLRPQAGIYHRNFAHALGHNHSILASATLGLRYTIGDYSRNHSRSNDEYNSDNKWFIQGSVGPTWRQRRVLGTGEVYALSFGKRFTPVSSWRLGVEETMYLRHPHYFSGVVTLDYLTSVSTAMAGYDPDRVFDLQGVLGVYAGVANHDEPIAATYGLRGGLQGNFRVSPKVDIFVEPLFLASRVPARHTGHWWTPQLRVYVGVKYRFGEGTFGTEYKASSDGKRNFIGVSAGPSIFSWSCTRNDYDITPTLDVSVGHWFSSVSGARLTYGTDWVHIYDQKHKVNSVHADYLLNISSIVDRQAEKKWHLIGAVGVGAGFCKDAEKDCGFMAYGGLQLRYNLPGGLDVHIEPGMEFWSDKVVPVPYTPHHFVATARLTGGFSFRF